jgi:hypothetical protein
LEARRKHEHAETANFERSANVRFRPIADIAGVLHPAVMSDMVWVSRAMKLASNLRPLRHSFSDDQRSFAVDCKRKNEMGEPLGPECFPEVIYGAPLAREKDYRLPNLFFAGSYWAVSKAAADVLRLFDLGKGALYPVRVLKSDLQTPVDDEWFCINIGNAKSVVAVEKSEKIRPGAQGRYIMPPTIADGQLAVSSEALTPPDVWIDPQIWDAFFMSAAVGNALRVAKAQDGFFLTKCRVV